MWLISGCLGFSAGFALCWFWRSKVEAAVVAVNASVIAAKADAANVASAANAIVNDIKKV